MKKKPKYRLLVYLHKKSGYECCLVQKGEKIDHDGLLRSVDISGLDALKELATRRGGVDPDLIIHGLLSLDSGRENIKRVIEGIAESSIEIAEAERAARMMKQMREMHGRRSKRRARAKTSTKKPRDSFAKSPKAIRGTLRADSEAFLLRKQLEEDGRRSE